jgi:hypothetical protein
MILNGTQQLLFYTEEVKRKTHGSWSKSKNKESEVYEQNTEQNHNNDS